MQQAIAEPQNRYIQLGDLNLHYLEWGTPGSIPFVMLHGYGDTAWLFKRMARTFEQNFHLFSLDLRGHGETTADHPGGGSQEILVKDITLFLDKLGLERIILCGYSFGGTIAHRYASQNSNCLRALCIIDIGVENTAITFDPKADPEKVRASIERAWERFKRIRCPTLLIRAENSHLLSREAAQKMVEILPVVELAVVEDADHKIFKRYEKLAEVLEKFLIKNELYPV